jgi:hypothetical protein
MGFFTARNRQPNPFAERKRRERERRDAEQETAAILADPDATEAIAEAEIEQAVPIAVPVDLNPDAEEYTQTPDISTYATGGVVPQTTVEDVVIGEHGPESVIPHSNISADTQAKIDAVMNRAIPTVVEQVEAIHATVEEATPVDTGAMRETSDASMKRGRGRPRPQETIDRDNAVHAELLKADSADGISKEALAVKLDEKEQQVYSSLRQLKKEGRAETRYVKPHGYRWFAL